MRFRKGNVVFNLKDKNQIDAFRNSKGWELEDEGAKNSTPYNPTCEPEQQVNEQQVNEQQVNEQQENEQQENETQYSRSEIARMSTANLKEVAVSLGLEVTEESTGKVLKEQILEKLGL